MADLDDDAPNAATLIAEAVETTAVEATWDIITNAQSRPGWQDVTGADIG